jgi:hypothetical protein
VNYYTIEPEVAGGWGEGTVFESRAGLPAIVTKLHYVFDGWLGDDLLESSACYIVTRRLADAIKERGLSGIDFDSVKISVSDEFREFFSDLTLPAFIWLKIVGEAGRDDFGLDEKLRLIISERALELLRSFQISHAGSLESKQ